MSDTILGSARISHSTREQVAYAGELFAFEEQVDARYRADGWDIGSGMIESGCKTVIGQRQKGAGMRWTDAGTQTVANVRLLLFNAEWDDYWAAA